METWKAAPFLTEGSSQTRPLCCSAISLTMASPRPDPSTFPAILLRLKDRKRFCIFLFQTDSVVFHGQDMVFLRFLVGYPYFAQVVTPYFRALSTRFLNTLTMDVLSALTSGILSDSSQRIWRPAS